MGPVNPDQAIPEFLDRALKYVQHPPVDHKRSNCKYAEQISCNVSPAEEVS
jgi:hypothetical protein